MKLRNDARIGCPSLKKRPLHQGTCDNALFLLNASYYFSGSVNTTPEKFENATIIGHFGFVFEENWGREITCLSRRHRFWKALFSKWFPSAVKRKASVFKFLRFEECFHKAPLSWRISLDGRSNRRKKLRFEVSLGYYGRGVSGLYHELFQYFVANQRGPLL